MKNLEYLVFITNSALSIIFGFLLILELIQSPDSIGIMFWLAMVSGTTFIARRFKNKINPPRERKFKSRFRR